MAHSNLTELTLSSGARAAGSIARSRGNDGLARHANYGRVDGWCSSVCCLWVSIKYRAHVVYVRVARSNFRPPFIFYPYCKIMCALSLRIHNQATLDRRSPSSLRVGYFILYVLLYEFISNPAFPRFAPTKSPYHKAGCRRACTSWSCIWIGWVGAGPVFRRPLGPGVGVGGYSRTAPTAVWWRAVDRY